MGNIVSDQNYNLKQTAISEFITDWAKYDFDNGLTYDDKTNTRYKYEFLRKRGCCTRNNIMKIALPEVDDNNLVNDKKFEYTPINILLSQPYTKTPDLCLLADELQSTTQNQNPQKRDYLYNIDNNKMMTGACIWLYEGDTSTTQQKNLCDLVKDENNLMFTDSDEINYGKYGTSSKTGNPTILLDNVFFDCNCKNSVAYDSKYKNLNVKYQDENGNTAKKINPDIAAQLFDLKCSTLTNNAYKKQLHDTPACIQINDFQDLTMDQSILKATNTCNVTEVNGQIATVPAGTPDNFVQPPPKVPELPDLPYSNFHNHEPDATTPTKPIGISKISLSDPSSSSVITIVSVAGVSIMVLIFILIKFLL